jgi:hypothetical protein
MLQGSGGREGKSTARQDRPPLHFFFRWFPHGGNGVKLIEIAGKSQKELAVGFIGMLFAGIAL